MYFGNLLFIFLGIIDDRIYTRPVKPVLLWQIEICNHECYEMPHAKQPRKISCTYNKVKKYKNSDQSMSILHLQCECRCFLVPRTHRDEEERANDKRSYLSFVLWCYALAAICLQGHNLQYSSSSNNEKTRTRPLVKHMCNCLFAYESRILQANLKWKCRLMQIRRREMQTRSTMLPRQFHFPRTSLPLFVCTASSGLEWKNVYSQCLQDISEFFCQSIKRCNLIARHRGKLEI